MKLLNADPKDVPSLYKKYNQVTFEQPVYTRNAQRNLDMGMRQDSPNVRSGLRTRTAPMPEVLNSKTDRMEYWSPTTGNYETSKRAALTGMSDEDYSGALKDMMDTGELGRQQRQNLTLKQRFGGANKKADKPIPPKWNTFETETGETVDIDTNRLAAGNPRLSPQEMANAIADMRAKHEMVQNGGATVQEVIEATKDPDRAEALRWFFELAKDGREEYADRLIQDTFYSGGLM